MNNLQLSEIFKTEYSNLIAILCHYYGVDDIQSAEDIVSDTFLQAMKSWSQKGIPDNPKAWLRKVAVNKLTDQQRRNKTFQEKVLINSKTTSTQNSIFEITEDIIEDSQLRMIFVICDPDLNKEAQIALALRILCGFNIEEIAKALLSNKESINKKLYRAKKTIKEKNQLNTSLTKDAYLKRLDIVLRVIYLLFNEGYYSSKKEENIRQDLCWEAMRLCIFLSNQTPFTQKKSYALIALMCFHASRLNARSIEGSEDLLYNEQDKSKWDKALIEKGKKYLHDASQGKIVSKYHLEAAIAYWHTVEEVNEQIKWENILQLYNKLLTLEYSPIIAMNRTYALAKANSVKEAIIEAQKLNLQENHLFYCLLAELFKMDGNRTDEKKHLQIALKFAKKENERQLINRKIILSEQNHT